MTERSRRRSVLFGILAVVLGLGLLEVGARAVEAFAPPGPVEARSVLVYQQIPRVFLNEVAEGRLQIAQEWVDTPGQSFATPKPADEIRIVVLGGSAVGGWGLPSAVTFCGVLQRVLDDITPDRTVRVLNLGRTGYASPQVAFAFEQVAATIDADLVITVMGNNERHDIIGGTVSAGGRAWVFEAGRAATRRLALARLLRPAKRGDSEGPDPENPALPALAELGDVSRVDRYVARRLPRTLGRIAAAAHASGAELLVSTVAVNSRFQHFPPHEWFFLGEEAFSSDAFRRAHWAWYHGAPDLGIEALEGLWTVDESPAAGLLVGHFQLRQGDTEAGRATLASVAELLKPGANDPPDPNRDLQRVWALSGTGDGGAELADQLIAGYRSDEQEPEPCGVADLLWYSGRRQESGAEYQACLLDRFLYRADVEMNASLLREADVLGALTFDLASELRSFTSDGVVGYGLFYDYCHYTPRGNLLVGHLLAQQVASALDLPRPPVAATALARHDEARRGRTTDLTSPDWWARVDFDVTLLTGLTEDGRAGEAAPAPPDAPQHLAMLYSANHLLDQISPENPDAGPQATELYEQALSLDPGSADARLGLRRVRQAVARSGLEPGRSR